MKTIIAITLSIGLGCISNAAHALNRYVGSGTGCTDTSIQAAVNALDNNGSSFNTLYIARSLTYTNQDIDIDMPGQFLLIVGVNACTDNTENGFTPISGAGGDTDPVFKISNTEYVEMRNLRITDGDHESAFKGGGIRFEGAGTLVLQDMQISLNTAGSGGGIAMIEINASFENPAKLTILQNVAITSNTARYDGGGIYLEGIVDMTLFRENSYIEGNAANGQPTGPGGTTEGGHGGGIYASNRAKARVGSGGVRFGNVNAIEVIQNNSAIYGGGVAVEEKSTSSSTTFGLYQTSAGFPPAMKNNIATVAGGAIWLRPKNGTSAFDKGFARAHLLDARIIGNQAPQGAAVYGETNFGVLGDTGSDLYINSPQTYFTTPQIVRCVAGQTCSQVVGNVASSPSGAIIYLENEGLNIISSTVISGNSANRLFDLDDAFARFVSVQMTDNTLSGPVFNYRDMDLYLWASTIAGNSIGTTEVIQGANLKLSRSIVYQPGKTIVSSNTGLALVDNVVNPGSGLPGIGGYFQTDPLFMDAGRSDYRLRAHSPAIDFAAAIPAEDGDVDILGNPRSLDLPIVRDGGNLQDSGAHERQNIGNLVLNPGFVDDPIEALRLWNYSVSPPATFSIIDRTGTAGSGSIQISAQTPTATAAIQCIGVPGPGVLRFTGYARTTQVVNGDNASLRWQLHDNSSTCQTAPSAFAVVPIPTSLSGWQAPVQDGVITVSALQWTPNTSILISLNVADGNDFGTDVFARFDDISLTYDTDTITDRIFADGFDP